MDLLTTVEKFGLGVALALGTFAAFVYLLKWTLKQQEAILSQASKERESWQLLFERNNRSIDEHIAQSREFHNSVNEAHKFQREEHKEMIASLGRINGFKEH